MNIRLKRFGIVIAALTVTLLASCAVVPGAPEGSRAQTVMLDHKDAKGNPIKLEMALYLPQGNGPFDVVLYTHGGPLRDKPALVNMPEESAAPFLKNNIAVAFLMRQGRGGSGGEVSFPKCKYGETLAAIDKDIKDMESGLSYIKNSPAFNGKKVYTTGHSQGGMLAAILAARYPDTVSKAVAFAPGWVATGFVCKSFAQNLQNHLFESIAKANAAPTLFIYADNDNYHPPKSVTTSFEKYRVEGGTGSIKMYHDISTKYSDGHFVIYRPDIWEDDVMAFLGIKKQAASEALSALQK